MKIKFLYLAMLAFLSTGMLFTSCDDDDDDDNNQTGNAAITIQNVSTKKNFIQSGTFRIEDRDNEAILPGESVSITFNAGKGQALMFATMYGYSNDVFFAPENPGIELFDGNGNAVTGDVSSKVRLWDNGTRLNQVPGANVEHPGIAETENVKMIDGTDAQENEYLAASELMRLTLAYTAATSEFTLTIANISTGKINETPFSPGVWVVSNMEGGNLVNDKPFFTDDERTTTALTALAETGNPTSLADWAEENTGIFTGLSPALVVVYSGTTNPLFTLNEKDGGAGLKELAQKGDTEPLKTFLESLRYVREVHVLGNGGIAPGESKEVSFSAYEGDNITFATMFGSSNDWFFANTETINSTYKGDVTGRVSLLDSGTAMSQYPGAGNGQALFGGTSLPEDDVVKEVDTDYPIPTVSQIIKVTLR